DYDKLAKQQQEILSLAKRFGDLHKAEEKVNELSLKKEKRNGWEKSSKDAKRAEKVRSLIEDCRKNEALYDQRKLEEADAERNKELKSKAAETAANELKKLIEKENTVEEYKKTKILYEGKRNDYDGLDELEKELEIKNTEAEASKRNEDEAKKQLTEYEQAVVNLKTQYNTISSEHDRYFTGYLAGISGEIAKKLEEGKPCPVCGSTVHPNIAQAAEDSISKEMLDAKDKEKKDKYDEIQSATEKAVQATKKVETHHSQLVTLNTKIAALNAQLESRRKNLVPGLTTLRMLEDEIGKLEASIKSYENEKIRLAEVEKQAVEAYTEAKTKIASAHTETEAAEKVYNESVKAVENGLSENGFSSVEEAEGIMLSAEEAEALSARVADYDAAVKSADESLKELREELKEISEPDEEKCQGILNEIDKAKREYSAEKARLSDQIGRLSKKASELSKQSEGMEEKLRVAESDFTFAKKLRGDSGTGLQRYVLGIMFSSVIAAANKMLELVHGGRYRLYRSDEKGQGTNKKGLELKVFDKYSMDHDGRFVSTLSGGEKFLASLALSIGMSTVAQKNGIIIEALFIDEGFGTLDEDSIGDAMNVLNSVQQSNGVVGIISHVQLLQDRIPYKLKIEVGEKGSHIVKTIG
ncbi:MAG: hypothetical protein K6F99_07335, partial [Lachnospiraceae bacterium]|nr:hypothetical protein [Lachnospiraceae bacterium]